MSQIPSGNYEIFYVDFSIGPENLVIRPLGLNDKDEVAILPEDDKAPKWTVYADSNSAELIIDGRAVAPVGLRIGISPGVPHRWFVPRSAPQPHPVGSDAYVKILLILSIFMDMGADIAWNPPLALADEATTVQFGSDGFPFYFKRVSRDQE
ncbi:hypothetical protein BJ165DRAFT_1406585 [Panaeolus papilionaceus]|nr:hypothetical protein BJ165DRAFT_1406585 [Panaeolus papilionaceus]